MRERESAWTNEHEGALKHLVHGVPKLLARCSALEITKEPAVPVDDDRGAAGCAASGYVRHETILVRHCCTLRAEVYWDAVRAAWWANSDERTTSGLGEPVELVRVKERRSIRRVNRPVARIDEIRRREAGSRLVISHAAVASPADERVGPGLRTEEHDVYGGPRLAKPVDIGVGRHLIDRGLYVKL